MKPPQGVYQNGFGIRITQIERIITDYTSQGQRSC